MFNNQKTNKNAVQLLSECNEAGAAENPEEYYRIALEAVKQNPMALEHVNTCKNNEYYYRIALEAVKQKGYTLQYVDENWAVENPKWYYDIVLEAVSQNGLALNCVNKNWASNNPELYKGIALEAVSQGEMALKHVNKCKNNEYYRCISPAELKKKGYALRYVDKDWVVKNPKWYYGIALVAMENGYALRFVDKDWAEKNLEKYYNIALAAVNQNGLALRFVGDFLGFFDKDWAERNPEKYYNIALAAVSQDGMALDLWFVDNDWAKNNPEKYYNIALAAVSQNGMALEVVSEELLKNPELYKKIALAAVSQNPLALQFADEVFRNNMKIAISSLIGLDSKHSKYGFTFEGIISKILSMTSIKNDILIYTYMLSNKNVSNKFKNALFDFFIQNNYALSDKFTLYKNILECYLFLSEGYTDEFQKDTLLANLSKDDSKQQLHMFLSIADPSALKNAKLAEFLNNDHNDHNDHNDIIKNYLAEDRYHLKYIKNLNNIYGWLSKNCCVLDYTKIINMINHHQMNPDTEFYPMRNDLIRLVLCYLKIEDLLELDQKLLQSFKLTPRAKLKGKYLEDIDLKFFGPDGYTSTGIEALVDAIKSNNGSLRNKGEDSNFNNTIYFLDDCLHKDYIELK